MVKRLRHVKLSPTVTLPPHGEWVADAPSAPTINERVLT